jgi:hypothetical protein
MLQSIAGQGYWAVVVLVVVGLWWIQLNLLRRWHLQNPIKHFISLSLNYHSYHATYLYVIGEAITTITILDISHGPVSYLKHNFSQTGFRLRLQLVPTQLGLIDRASSCLPRHRLALNNGPNWVGYSWRRRTGSSLWNVVFSIRELW